MRLRKQIDLPVGRQRKDVDELDRRAAVGRRRHAALEQFRADAVGHPSRDPHQRLGLVLRRADAQPFGQLREDVRVGARLAVRLDHRPHAAAA